MADRQRLARLLAEHESRKKSRNAVDFAELCFPHQRAFVEDPSPFVVACTSRRAGKTEGLIFKMLRTASLRPRSLILYITISRPSAKRIMWQKLQRWDRELSLGASWNGTDLTMTLPNGSVLALGGANDEAEIERYRGIETPLVVIDEAQSFRPFLESLIEDVLEPTGWGIGGQVIMTGTPNASGIGYFARASNPDAAWHMRGDQRGEKDKVGAWSRHHWTALDNPHMTGLLEQWKAKYARLGLTETSPKVRREHYGEWVRDDTGLVYQIPDMVLVPELPAGEWEFHLGVDVGHVDATAFVVTAVDRAARRTATVLSYQLQQAIPATIHAEVDRLEARFDFVSEVMDPGGGGKLVIEERNRLFGGRFVPAQKQAKRTYIELLNGAMKAGSHLIVQPANEDLLDQASAFRYDTGRTDAGKLAILKDKLKFDERSPDDLLDAMLYSWRAAAFAPEDGEHEAAKPGTDEWWAEQRQQMLDRAASRVRGPDDPDQPWWAM